MIGSCTRNDYGGVFLLRKQFSHVVRLEVSRIYIYMWTDLCAKLIGLSVWGDQISLAVRPGGSCANKSGRASRRVARCGSGHY